MASASAALPRISTRTQQSAARRVEGIMNTNRPEIFVAKTMFTSIVPPVAWNWKCIRLGALTALLALGAAGCSGIHASKSVSPATFLLPGLMKNETPTAQDSIIAPAPPGELFAQK